MPTNLKGGQLFFLSKQDVEKIHDASLKVLEEVGMKSASKSITKFFSEKGAEVNVDTDVIKIPESLIREALKKAPNKVTIYGRDKKKAIELVNKKIYFGLGGTPTPYILDYKTNEWRRPGKEDVVNATRLGESLSEMDFIMTIAGAFDVPYQLEYIHEWAAILNNTTKPVVYSAPGLFNAEKVVQMGKAIKGEALKKEPPFGAYVELASPLSFNLQNENVFQLAQSSVPIVVGQMPQLGATVPVTFAGAAAISNAENLAVLTFAQLVNPGTPYIFGAHIAPLDMRTARLDYGAPEFAMGNIVNSSLAEFYHLPSFGWGGCSDSKLPDAQAGAEVMMNSLVAATSGINLIHDCGYLAAGSIGSLEAAVIASEIAGMVKRIVRGMEINEETLALDVIREIGPGGQFLSHPHTLKHVSKLYMADIFNKESEVKWAKKGKKDVRTIAKSRVEQLLSQPPSQDKTLNEKLNMIVKKAEQEIRGK